MVNSASQGRRSTNNPGREGPGESLDGEIHVLNFSPAGGGECWGRGGG